MRAGMLISIEPSSSAGPEGFTTVGRAWLLGPEGAQFDVPVTVSLPVPGGVDPNAALVIVTSPRDAVHFETLHTTRRNGELSATVSHFSIFIAGYFDGGETDAGEAQHERDAGGLVDAGPAADAGTTSDADAGTTSDAGAGRDGGVADGGTVLDAGIISCLPPGTRVEIPDGGCSGCIPYGGVCEITPTGEACTSGICLNTGTYGRVCSAACIGFTACPCGYRCSQIGGYWGSEFCIPG